MKKILTSLFLIYSIWSFGQSPSFPSSSDASLGSVSWHNLHTTFSESRPGQIDYVSAQHYYMDGDSTINGKQYTKLRSTNSDTSKSFLGGLYRVENEKVFRLENNEEYLEYDFGMEVGDTFFANNGGRFVVQKIDSITLFDGVHKVIDFGQASFIRGIGSPQGLFTFMGYNVSGFSDELICFSKDGEAIYPKHFDITCYEVVKLDVKEVEYAAIEVYPNPCSYQLNIPNARQSDECSVYSMHGELVGEYNGQSTISVLDFPEGIYYLNLERENIRFYSKFIVLR